jgi:RNA polymerase sigma-70 factor (ECF subfamily)
MDAGNGADRFGDVMLPHMDAAYALARMLVRDPGVAEEVVQDSFLRAFRGFAGWRGDSAKAWLLTIVRNCAMNSLTGPARRVTVTDMTEWADDPPPALIERDDPEAVLARKGDAALLRSAIESLPAPYREAIVLRELEELSYRDIATVTEAPIGTVMSRLARGRQMLADRLLPAREACAEDAVAARCR